MNLPLLLCLNGRATAAVSLLLAMFLSGSIVAARAQLPVDLGRSDQQEVNRWILTKDTLEKVLKINATVAAQLAKDPLWRRQLATEAKTPAEQSLAEAVKRLRGQARLVTWLEDAGLEPRAYVVAQLALLQAAVTNDNVKAGLSRPPKPDAGALLQNLAFVEANAADVRRFTAGIEQISTLIDEEGR